MPPKDVSFDQETEQLSTGLPAFKTWRSLYLFVIFVFLVCVILLKVFELVFS